MKPGYIGIGLMGIPMVLRLLKSQGRGDKDPANPAGVGWEADQLHFFGATCEEH